MNYSSNDTNLLRGSGFEIDDIILSGMTDLLRDMIPERPVIFTQVVALNFTVAQLLEAPNNFTNGALGQIGEPGLEVTNGGVIPLLPTDTFPRFTDAVGQILEHNGLMGAVLGLGILHPLPLLN